MRVFFSKSFFFVPSHPPWKKINSAFFRSFSAASPTPRNLSNFSADVLDCCIYAI